VDDVAYQLGSITFNLSALSAPRVGARLARPSVFSDHLVLQRDQAAPLGRLRVDLGSGLKRRSEIEWIKLCTADGSILAQWTFTDCVK